MKFTNIVVLGVIAVGLYFIWKKYYKSSESKPENIKLPYDWYGSGYNPAGKKDQNAYTGFHITLNHPKHPKKLHITKKEKDKAFKNLKVGDIMGVYNQSGELVDKGKIINSVPYQEQGQSLEPAMLALDIPYAYFKPINLMYGYLQKIK